MKLKGKLAGDKHPRFGKFGVDNPQYGGGFFLFDRLSCYCL